MTLKPTFYLSILLAIFLYGCSTTEPKPKSINYVAFPNPFKDILVIAIESNVAGKMNLKLQGEFDGKKEINLTQSLISGQNSFNLSVPYSKPQKILCTIEVNGKSEVFYLIQQ